MSRASLETPYVAPQCSLHQILHDIWAEVLGLSRIGIDDNFVALGGHSLAGAQVIARIENELGVTLPLRTLLEQPTIAELTLIIEDIFISEIEDLTDDEVTQLMAESE